PRPRAQGAEPRPRELRPKALALLARAVGFVDEQQDPAAVPIVLRTAEAVDALGPRGEELLTGARQTPPHAAADPLRFEPAVGTSSCDCLARRRLLDPQGAESAYQRRRPDFAAGREHVL